MNDVTSHSEPDTRMNLEICVVAVLLLLSATVVRGQRGPVVLKKDSLLYSAHKRFQQCCEIHDIAPECKQLCRYGMNPDYARSYYITKCGLHDANVVKSYFHCANEEMDNAFCCRQLGINHDCCQKYLGFKQDGFEDARDLLGQCENIFVAIMRCPYEWFGIVQ